MKRSRGSSSLSYVMYHASFLRHFRTELDVRDAVVCRKKAKYGSVLNTSRLSSHCSLYHRAVHFWNDSDRPERVDPAALTVVVYNGNEKSIFDVKLRVGKNNWEKQSALSNKSLSGNLWPLCRLVSLISGSSKTGARSVGTFLLCFFFLRAVIRFAIKTSFKNKWMKFVVFCLTAKQMPMGRC